MQRTLDLSAIRGAIFDMDGVIWRGPDILPDVPEFFYFLRDHHIPYVLATNNSSKNVQEYVTRLSSLGIPVDSSNIVTSSLVTVEELSHSYPPGTPVYVIGSPSLIQLLVDAGYVIDFVGAKAVIVGLDVTLTYEKLLIGGRLILAGAEFVGTNGDLTLPTADGIAPGNGSVLAALQAMTGRKPRLMGKPEPAMFRVALKQLGTTAAQTLMIGDRLDTDIEGAQKAGLPAALVLTGVSQRDDVGVIQPDAIFTDLVELRSVWSRLIQP
jgi:4-nitrophenyl phosphatase